MWPLAIQLAKWPFHKPPSKLLQKPCWICKKKRNIWIFEPTIFSQYYKVVFEQSSSDDLSKLQTLTRCLHLFNHLPEQPPKGVYLSSILRFHAHHNNFILIGSKNSLALWDIYVWFFIKQEKREQFFLQNISAIAISIISAFYSWRIK